MGAATSTTAALPRLWPSSTYRKVSSCARIKHSQLSTNGGVATGWAECTHMEKFRLPCPGKVSGFLPLPNALPVACLTCAACPCLLRLCRAIWRQGYRAATGWQDQHPVWLKEWGQCPGFPFSQATDVVSVFEQGCNACCPCCRTAHRGCMFVRKNIHMVASITPPIKHHLDRLTLVCFRVSSAQK